MGCSKCVIDIDIPKRSELLSEFSNLSFICFDLLAIFNTFAFFFKMISQIFKEDDLAIG
jgi:hypothetical protein